MLKKLLTGCLTIAAAAALAMPAMAADVDGKAGGRAIGEIVSHSEKVGDGDSVSWIDMQSQGRLDYTVTVTDGDWTAMGKTEIRSANGEDAYDDMQILQKYVKIGNDAFYFALGTKWWSWYHMTPFVGESIDRHCYACTNPRTDRLEVGLKEVGLNFFYGLSNDGKDTDATGDAYDISELGVEFKKAFGPVNVAAAYYSYASAANENLDADTVDTANDGYTLAEMSFGVQYVLNDAMFIEFDYESTASTTGISGADTDSDVWMGLAFAMALSEKQGFMVSYEQNTYNTGASNDEDRIDTYLIANFEQKLGGAKLWAGYKSRTQTDDDVDDDSSWSDMVIGTRVNF